MNGEFTVNRGKFVFRVLALQGFPTIHVSRPSLQMTGFQNLALTGPQFENTDVKATEFSTGGGPAFLKHPTAIQTTVRQDFRLPTHCRMTEC
jgi:hypothetical protein